MENEDAFATGKLIMQNMKVFWSAFPPALPYMELFSWQNVRKIKEKQLLPCFRIRETDTTQRHYLLNKSVKELICGGVYEIFKEKQVWTDCTH